jgi:tripartite-type tricarboxylate transporter receptor subunit TctC
MCGPAGLPEPIVTRLRSEVNKLLAQPDTKERFSNAGALEPFLTTPDQLTALIRSEYAKYGKVVKDIGAKVD